MHDGATIAEMQEILQSLGLEKKLLNLRSACVVMALSGLEEGTPWEEANGRSLGIHEIIACINAGSYGGKSYAENSRETVRKDTIRPLLISGLAVKNPGKSHVHNSAKTNYRLTDEFVALLRVYGTTRFDMERTRLLARMDRQKKASSALSELSKRTVILSDGLTIDITHDGQGDIIQAVIEEFLPHFAADAEVMYVADAAGDIFVEHRLDKKALEFIRKAVTSEDTSTGTLLKPDVVCWDAARGWLYIFEACATTGVIDEKRKTDLASMFSGLTQRIIFVTCFRDRDAMRPWLSQLAWETEAWTAEEAYHLIRFDGARFLEPR